MTPSNTYAHVHTWLLTHAEMSEISVMRSTTMATMDNTPKLLNAQSRGHVGCASFVQQSTIMSDLYLSSFKIYKSRHQKTT